MKSKYSFKEFTLICAETAPMSARATKRILTLPEVQTAVPIPRNTLAGVNIRKGMRIGAKIFFNVTMIIYYHYRGAIAILFITSVFFLNLGSDVGGEDINGHNNHLMSLILGSLNRVPSETHIEAFSIWSEQV